MRIILILAIIFHHSAFAFSLKEAEESASANDPKIRSFQESQTAFDARKNSTIAGLFPKFSFDYAKTYRAPQKPFTQSEMQFRATFQNPLWHFAQQDSINAEKKLLDLEKNAYHHEVLLNVRTSYFKIKLLELQIVQAKKHHATLYDVFRSVENKYTQGRIPSIDKDRSQVQVVRQDQLISSLNAQYESQKSVFALRVKKSEKMADSLSTPLPSVFKAVPASLAGSENPSIKREVYNSERNQSTLKSANSEFLPDFFLAVQKNDIIDPITEQKFVAYSGGLSWKLSPGSYYNRKEALAKISASKSLVDYEKRQGDMDLALMISELNSTIMELVGQESIVKTLSKISSQSLVQYQGGFTSLSTYYQEFRDMLDAEDLLLNKRYKMVELYAKLAKYLEDDSIFHNGMVL